MPPTPSWTLLSVMITLNFISIDFFFRPLLLSNFSDNLISLFILNILSVPGLILHLSSIAPDVSLFLSPIF